MAAAPKENLGKMPCPCCGQPVALKRSATQKLSFVCDDADCEQSGYANPHTGAARKWLSLVTKRASGGDPLPLVMQPEPKPAKTAQEAPKQVDMDAHTPAPKKTAPRSPFDLASLMGVSKA
jgi:hypothetical protein